MSEQQRQPPLLSPKEMGELNSFRLSPTQYDPNPPLTIHYGKQWMILSLDHDSQVSEVPTSGNAESPNWRIYSTLLAGAATTLSTLALIIAVGVNDIGSAGPALTACAAGLLGLALVLMTSPGRSDGSQAQGITCPSEKHQSSSVLVEVPEFFNEAMLRRAPYVGFLRSMFRSLAAQQDSENNKYWEMSHKAVVDALSDITLAEYDMSAASRTDAGER